METRSNMTNKIIGIVIVVLVVAAIVVGVAVAASKKDKNKTNSSNNTNQTNSTRTIQTTPGADITFYYGESCPHCQKVEQSIRDENLDQKVAFDMKEVWSSEANNKEMQAKADICKISQDQLGVPFLFDGKNQKCYVGEVDVLKFLEDQAAAAPTNTNSTANTNGN